MRAWEARQSFPDTWLVLLEAAPMEAGIAQGYGSVGILRADCPESHIYPYTVYAMCSTRVPWCHHWPGGSFVSPSPDLLDTTVY